MSKRVDPSSDGVALSLHCLAPLLDGVALPSKDVGLPFNRVALSLAGIAPSLSRVGASLDDVELLLGLLALSLNGVIASSEGVVPSLNGVALSFFPARALVGPSRARVGPSRARVGHSRDASQHRSRHNRRAFCEAKGRLYFAIKDINNAGHALHSGDLERAAKFNLKALYGRGKRKPAPEPVAPTAK